MSHDLTVPLQQGTRFVRCILHPTQFVPLYFETLWPLIGDISSKEAIMKHIHPHALFRLSVLGPLASRDRLEKGELNQDDLAQVRRQQLRYS